MGVFSRGTCHTVPNILEDTCAARNLGLPGLSAPDHAAAARKPPAFLSQPELGIIQFIIAVIPVCPYAVSHGHAF